MADPEDDANLPETDHFARRPTDVLEKPLNSTPAAADHFVARGLTWIFRGLALIGGIWGVMNTISTIEAAQTAKTAAAQIRAFPNRPFADTQEPMADLAQRAVSMSIFMAMIVTVAVVAIPLALAELLRLFVLIESNTRTQTLLIAGLTKRSG